MNFITINLIIISGILGIVCIPYYTFVFLSKFNLSYFLRNDEDEPGFLKWLKGLVILMVLFLILLTYIMLYVKIAENLK
jgi:hypothetical protein